MVVAVAVAVAGRGCPEDPHLPLRSLHLPHRYCADCLDELLEHGNSCEPPKMVLCPQCRRPAPWTAPDPPSLGFLLDDDGGAASIAAARRSRRCCLLAVVCVVALSSALSWWSVSIITQQFGL